MKAFLDMDGVIADFLGAVSKAHNRPLPYDRPEALGVWETEVLWGISPKEFWEPCDGPDFWSGLEKMPDADGIVQAVVDTFGEENVAILTAPSSSPYVLPGKQKWIEKFYPSFSKRIIFGSAKEFLAGPERVLIDDRDKNIKDFERAGGRTVLVPRAWNSAHPFRHATLFSVQQQLMELGIK